MELEDGKGRLGSKWKLRKTGERWKIQEEIRVQAEKAGSDYDFSRLPLAPLKF
jgi:hypothetical protein